MQALYVAVFVVLLVLVLWLARAPSRNREGFASPKAHEVYRGAREVFSKNADASFSEYKSRIPDSNAVQYTDVRQLHLANKLSPETVQSVLG